MTKPRRKPLVTELTDFLERFVVMDETKTLIVALWIIHSHCVAASSQTPYLSVTSPERQCGKSRLLEALELLVARPWMTVLPSEAVVYRFIDKGKPTLLLDEVDTIFNPRTADRYEGLRALLNAGHRRGATVPRCVGSSNKVVEFSTFCPKVLAGIGTLPDTVADRSIPIRLERKKRDEKVERFNRRAVEPEAVLIRTRIETWAEKNLEALDGVQIDMPEELSDREQDGCEPLMAIAERLNCGPKVRKALIKLFTVPRLDDQETMRLRLLRDMRVVFGDRRVMSTAKLIERLVAIEEAPWSGYYNRGLDPRDIGSLLRPYEISSKAVRLKSGQVAKGFHRDDLQDAWSRYL
jgi:hypothetical protein